MQTFIEYIKNRINKKLIDRIGDYNIYLVNAASVRGLSQEDDEFNHFATHLEFPKLVPNNEIWISEDISSHERQFLIANALTQYKAKKQGKKNWYDIALKKEKAQREISDNIKFHHERHNEKPPNKVYYKLYCHIGNIEVWLINGEIVRDLFKTDFIEGGNGQVYSFVPNNEIWIEKNLKEPGEKDITILHEYIESTLMKYKKLNYSKAHNIASKVEYHHRGKWNKNEVLSLTKEKALQMAKPYT